MHKLAPFFTEGFGRPTKELYTVLGVLIIQQMMDLTDEETITHPAFNEQWHYALDIPDETDESTYMNPPDALEYAPDRDGQRTGYTPV